MRVAPSAPPTRSRRCAARPPTRAGARRSGAGCSASCWSRGAPGARRDGAQASRRARRGAEGALRVARARGRRRGARPLPQPPPWPTSTRWRRRDRAGTPTPTWWHGSRPTTCSALRQGVADLWSAARELVKKTIEQPGNVGWRARGELVEWWTLDGLPRGAATAAAGHAGAPARPRSRRRRHAGRGPAAFEAAAKLYGCVEKARLAGPFGHVRRVRPPRPLRGRARRALARRLSRATPPPRGAARPRRRARRLRAPGAGRRRRASTTSRPSSTSPPIARSFIAVQGAFAIFVDDTEVLTRDTRVWGIWPRFAARVRLEAGRHRILARVAGAGDVHPPPDAHRRPARHHRLRRSRAPYAITPPESSPIPTRSSPFLAAVGVPPQRGVPRAALGADTSEIPSPACSRPTSPTSRDRTIVGAVLLEPLVKDPDIADAPTTAAAGPGRGPPAPRWRSRPRCWRRIPSTRRARRATASRRRARESRREGPGAVVAALLAAARRGGQGRRARRGRPSSRRSPTSSARCRTSSAGSPPSTGASAGSPSTAPRSSSRPSASPTTWTRSTTCSASATRTARRRPPTTSPPASGSSIPEAEIDFERAVERRDFRAAIGELSGSASIRKDRRDIAVRIADLLTRAGASQESLAKLEAAVQKKPLDPEARLSLADARLARGDRGRARARAGRRHPRRAPRPRPCARPSISSRG